MGDTDNGGGTSSLQGDDFIDGGEGNDNVRGDGGADLLYGGADNDLLLGDADDVSVVLRGMRHAQHLDSL